MTRLKICGSSVELIQLCIMFVAAVVWWLVVDGASFYSSIQVNTESSLCVGGS